MNKIELEAPAKKEAKSIKSEAGLIGSCKMLSRGGGLSRTQC